MTETLAEIPRLEAALKKAADAYYNGTPLITDAQFDALEARLRTLDPTNAWFTSRVGAPVPETGGWQKTAHSQPMGSLDKCQTAEDYQKWVQSVGGPATMVTVMGKLDGASLSTAFDAGKFTQALTRGDGIQGEDITRNVKRMIFPKVLPNGTTCLIRAEVVCKRSAFKAHFPGQSNPRNTANGTMKRQSDAEDCQYLTVIGYDITPPQPTKQKDLALLKSWGFEVPTHVTCRADQVPALYQTYIDKTRESLDYEIDGLVITVDDTDLRESFGVSGNCPRGATAYKFPHEEKETTLTDVVWQVGKSGRVTPVALFAPVVLVGANVERCSLHNVANCASLASGVGAKTLSKGDKVLVSRRNDVIPFLEAVVAPAGGAPFLPPTSCPACSNPVVMDGEYLVCRNPDCPAQVKGAIVRWLQKTGVLHFGESLVECLIDAGMVTTPADLYSLDPIDVAALDMGGRRVGGTADRALKSLEANMVMDLHTFLGSLGIPLWGRSMCKMLVDAGYDTLAKCLLLTEAEIAAIPGIGQTKAESFVSGLVARENLVGDLIGAGIKLKVKASGHLTSKSMCLTGFRDAALEKAFEAAGGTVKSSVGKGLTYLVALDPQGNSEKLKKARAFGTLVVSADEIRRIIG